jgi:hypothetical protein
MAWQSIALPLYEDEDFSYSTTLEGNTYIIRLYLNRRVGEWYLDLSTDDGEPLVTGTKLVQFYPMLLDYRIPNLTGFMWFQTKNSGVVADKSVLPGYYELFYMWDEE